MEILLEDFTQDIEELREEEEKLEELYDELKTHYDEVKKNSRKMNNGLSFLHLQASNLITIRNNKLNIKKTIIDIKNKKILNNLKAISINKNNEEDSLEENNLFTIMDKLLERIPKDNMMKTVTGINMKDSIEDDIDSLLNNRLEIINQEKSNNMKNKDLLENIPEEIYENELLRLVSDELGYMHLVDEDLNEYNLEENGYIITEMANISLCNKDSQKIIATYQGNEIDLILKKNLKK
jgi:hypothetical protein